MTLSELFLIVIPAAWLLWSLFVTKPAGTLKFVLRWAVPLIGCLALSYLMNQKLSQMMGG